MGGRTANSETGRGHPERDVMRYFGILAMLIAVGIILYMAAPKPGNSPHSTYNVATGAAQHAAGAAEQHVRDVLKPLGGTNP